MIGFGLVCVCDPLADEHCDVCRNRHKFTGQAFMLYEKDGPLLSVENLSLSFGDLLVLRDINVRIRHIVRNGLNTGRIVAFLGSSGCGKTSFLRCLAGLQNPTKGGIFLSENRQQVKAGLVGLVSQQSILYPNRTVLENLKIAARQRYKPVAEADKHAIEMLQRFGLWNKRDVYPVQLSGGQRQRIAILQQLLCSEHYLLMDEPTAGLDPGSKKDVSSLITELANANNEITIIIVTHDIAFASAVADTIWLMGWERDEAKNIIPGAKIIDTYDLIECGLCWNPNVLNHPAYAPLVQELTNRLINNI